MNTTEVDTLFALTLIGDYDGEAGWAAVAKLRLDGSREIFERAAAWCQSDEPLKRARATDVLCQLMRAPEPDVPTNELAFTRRAPLFREGSYSIVTRMLRGEQDLLVLRSAVHALGHLGNSGAVPLILSYRDHLDRNIRFAATFALGCFPNDAGSVLGLMKLTSDTDPDVRDWAVFGLGVLGDVDSPEIRETLLQCLDDDSQAIREEAAVGLGKRRDQRLIPKLRTMLDEPELGSRVAEASAALLGLDRDPPEWGAADYKAALMDRFPV
jgi:HEAT repeat protein